MGVCMPNIGSPEIILAFPTLGAPELIIILIIVVLIFGVNKIPQLGKGLGEGIRNFKSSIKAVSEDAEAKPEDKSKDEKQS
jgi:sec-independent protein translocase protein TatA